MIHRRNSVKRGWRTIRITTNVCFVVRMTISPRKIPVTCMWRGTENKRNRQGTEIPLVVETCSATGRRMKVVAMATCRQRNCTFMQMFQTPEKKSDVIRDIRESECVMILSIPSDNRSILMSCKMKTSRPRRLSDVPLTSLKRKKKKKEKKKLAESIKIITVRKQIRIRESCFSYSCSRMIESNRLGLSRNHFCIVTRWATPLLCFVVPCKKKKKITSFGVS